MPSLRIEFDPKTLEAILSSDPGPHWEAIRRACEDCYEEIAVSGTSLRLPWWAFLSCRQAIGYYVTAHSLELEVDDLARVRLEAAVNSSAELSRADEIAPTTVKVLLPRLSAAGFSRSLKSFQTKNIQSLTRLKVGATFSVPGAGKTTEALAFFAFHRSTASRLLVVAPKNAFAAWEEQLVECMPKRQETFRRLTGGRGAISKLLQQERPALMLITYQQFPNVEDVIGDYLSQYDSFVFLDESHRIKGGTDRVIASSVLRVTPVATHRLIMSGTPLPNSKTDLLPQIAFLAPELEVDASTVEDVIRPFYVRTTKKDLKLPKAHRTATLVNLAPAQRHLYELMRSELAREANNMLSRRDKQAFRRIGRSAIRLLQFVSNPALLARKDFEYDRFLGVVLEEGDSPKLEHACRRARELASEGKKTVIWSSFVENVELISERLIDLGADYIHGGVEASSEYEADSRERKIKRFHDDRHAMVLVANPAACSEGISLHTVCQNAIYVDRNFNAAQYLQSEDRIHRIGSDKEVYIEVLLAPDSIDDIVSKRLDEKVKIMASVLNDPGLTIELVSSDLDQTDPDDEDVLAVLQHLHTATQAA